MVHIFINALSGFIVLLPLLLLWQRGILTKKKEKLPLAHLCMGCVFAFSILGILSATGVPSLGDVHRDFYVKLEFFRGNRYNYVQYVLNVILFVPFGFFLPLLWKRFRFFPYIVILGFLFSVAIETAQLFNYRTTDVDDVIMNTLGAVVGYLVFLVGKWLLPKGFDCFHSGKKKGDFQALFGYVGAAWSVIFFAAPFLVDEVWRIFENI